MIKLLSRIAIGIILAVTIDTNLRTRRIFINNNLNFKKMGQEFDELEKEVTETSDATDAIIVFVAGIKAQLDAAGTDATKLKALSTKLDEGQQRIAAAILANTPAATTDTTSGGGDNAGAGTGTGTSDNAGAGAGSDAGAGAGAGAEGGNAGGTT